MPMKISSTCSVAVSKYSHVGVVLEWSVQMRLRRETCAEWLGQVVGTLRCPRRRLEAPPRVVTAPWYCIAGISSGQGRLTFGLKTLHIVAVHRYTAGLWWYPLWGISCVYYHVRAPVDAAGRARQAKSGFPACMICWSHLFVCDYYADVHLFIKFETWLKIRGSSRKKYNGDVCKA